MFVGIATVIALVGCGRLRFDPSADAADDVDVPVSSGLIGHWKLDDASGLVAADSSGRGFDGTLVNGPIWTTGRLAGALEFTAINAAISTVHIGRTFDLAQLPLSITAWVQPQDRVVDQTVIAKRDAYTVDNERFQLYLEISTGRVALDGGSLTTRITFAYAVPTGAWTHLAVVATPAETTLYVDGALRETAGVYVLGLAATANTAIGSNAQSPTLTAGAADAFKGGIDDVRVYDRALAADEVTQIANL